MKTKTVTLSDIARELGISSNAVSLALRGKEGVSDALRNQVLQKAAQMNYNRAEKIRGNIIAVIPQRIAPMQHSGTFYQQLCFHMEYFARSMGYLLMMCSVSEQEEDELILHPMLTNIPCAGIISIGNLSREYCQLIGRLGKRFVMADQYYDDVLVDSINTANSSAGYLLTQLLIEKGHTNIQYFGQARKTSSLADRWNGYKRAMWDYRLPVLHNQFIDADVRDGTKEYQYLQQAINALPELPTAFVCGHDVTAMMIRELLTPRGLHCPEDFSLVGFDNVNDSSLLIPNLTTYSTPGSLIAETAVRTLLDDDVNYPRRIQLFGEIIQRSSVKDIRS